MELYLSSQTIDISNEFSLLQFLNFPFPIENEYYYIETEETFLAINDGYLYRITNQEAFILHQSAIDDRNYTTWSENAFSLQVEYHRQADVEVDEIQVRWRTLEPNGILLVMEDEYAAEDGDRQVG